MVAGKRILIASATLAVFALPAFAQDRVSYQAGAATPRLSSQTNSQGRKVAVWRDELPPLPPSPRQLRLAQNDLERSGELADDSAPDDAPLAADHFNAHGLTEGHAAQAAPLPAADQNYQVGGCECGNCDCQGCCMPFWAHRSGTFGELLCLRASGLNIAFQQNIGAPAVPAGDVGVLDPVSTANFRVGFARALDNCSSFEFAYTNFFSHTEAHLTAPDDLGGNGQGADATNFLAAASSNLRFQMVDVDYRRLVCAGCRHAVNYTVGLRYASLKQHFQQLDNFEVPILTSTAIDFDGVGLRTGIDGSRQIGNSRLGVYGKGFISVLFGEFHSTYTQSEDTAVQALSKWTDNRPVPILEYELGINWTSRNGRWLMSSGYYTAFWFNIIDTQQFVQAVQSSNFVHLGETLSFNGFVSRLEFRF